MDPIKEPLEVTFTQGARADLLEVWLWNAETYGQKRADSYLKVLDLAILSLAQSPTLGLEVVEVAGLRRHIVRRRSRAHGHIIFYRIDGPTLVVVHIFHTAQDWRTRLS